MMDEEFVAAVAGIILPVLEPHGFQRIKEPDGWITPGVLFESQNRWFGASWDWRDKYLEACLGRLFLFRDVLPRVIVRGPLSVAETSTGENDADFVRTVLGRVAARLPEVLEHFDEVYPPSIGLTELTASPDKGVRKAAREFSRFLGSEVTLEEWQRLSGMGNAEGL
jgi:hypothetical protein